MGTFANVLQDWSSVSEDKATAYISTPGLLVRWLNEGQLRFVNESEVLRGSWSATVTSGTATLPSDFLREIADRVSWAANQPLTKIDYPTAYILNASSAFTSTDYYSIWGETFYVWGSDSGTPTIPYIKKPAVITTSNYTTSDLDLPTEFHHALLTFLDAMWLREKGDVSGYQALLKEFMMSAINAGQKYRERRDPVAKMRSNRY